MDRHHWNERYLEKELLWTAEPNQFLVECVSGLVPGAALDLACGEGRNAVWLAEQGWRVTAVDWSEVGISKGRALAETREVEVDFVEADLLEWVPPGESAALVIVVYLQIPSPGRDLVWRKAAAAVGRRGRLVVIGHDSSNLTRGYGGPQDPRALYTAADVVDALGDLLTIERADLVERPVEGDDGMRVALDNVVVGLKP
jgi:SAM-dependent methyltransferase